MASCILTRTEVIHAASLAVDRLDKTINSVHNKTGYIPACWHGERATARAILHLANLANGDMTITHEDARILFPE